MYNVHVPVVPGWSLNPFFPNVHVLPMKCTVYGALFIYPCDSVEGSVGRGVTGEIVDNRDRDKKKWHWATDMLFTQSFYAATRSASDRPKCLDGNICVDPSICIGPLKTRLAPVACSFFFLYFFSTNSTKKNNTDNTFSVRVTFLLSQRTYMHVKFCLV